MKIFLLVLAAVFILSLPALVALGIRSVPLNIQPVNEQTEKIFVDNVVSQKFLANENNILAIGVSLKNPNLNNKKDILMEIREVGYQTPIRKAVLNGSYIQDGKFVKFNFLPIADSKGKIYEFTLSAISANHLDALEVYYSHQELSESKGLNYGRKEQDGNLSYVVFAKPATPLTVPIQIYKDWFNRLYQDQLFFYFYILILTVGVVGFLIT